MVKKITLEDLARMVKRGFDVVDDRFEQVDKRFEQIDKRFEHIDARFTEVESKIDYLTISITEIRQMFGPLAQDVIRQEQVTRDLRRRVERLERKSGISHK